MNFVFISPNFPKNYWQFCAALKANGANVLGIGDAPYDELCKELKDSLTEYYLCQNMLNYDEMYKAVAYFAYKYGKIDWLESNNEFWLQTDAQLRTDFNITSGIRNDQIDSIKEKSEMKKYYAKGGIRTARQIKAKKGLEAVMAFAEEAGYPLFSKPDIGVGAGGAHKINNEEELRKFFHDTPDVSDYVIEEFVTGNICTYDAIIDSNGDPLFESNCVCPPSIADIVEYRLDSTYYVQAQMSENLRFWGRRTVKAFDIKSRFVHLEFFCLDRAHKGLGEVGDFVALEVNMRPGGGYTPDMINYAHSVDVYKIWADMICFDRSMQPVGDDYWVMYAGRRDGVEYHLSHEDLMEKYQGYLQMWERIPDALSGAMGNQSYIGRFPTKEQMDEFVYDVCNRK